MTKRTARGDLSSLGFQLYISLSGTSFLTCIVVNTSYILQEENFKYFKELVFSHSQAVAKSSSMTWSLLALLRVKGVLWRSQGISERERMFSFKTAESSPLSVWAQARRHWSFFLRFVFLTPWVSLFEILGPSPLIPPVVVMRSYAHSNVYYRVVLQQNVWKIRF